jgi:hypothetical protein
MMILLVITYNRINNNDEKSLLNTQNLLLNLSLCLINNNTNIAETFPLKNTSDNSEICKETVNNSVKLDG